MATKRLLFKIEEKMHIMIMVLTFWGEGGVFVNFRKILRTKFSLKERSTKMFHLNSVRFPVKFLGKSARGDVKKNKLCTQYYLLLYSWSIQNNVHVLL